MQILEIKRSFQTWSDLLGFLLRIENCFIYLADYQSKCVMTPNGTEKLCRQSVFHIDIALAPVTLTI